MTTITIILSILCTTTDLKAFQLDVYPVANKYGCKIATFYPFSKFYDPYMDITGETDKVWKVIDTLAKDVTNGAELSAATQLVFNEGLTFKGKMR